MANKHGMDENYARVYDRMLSAIGQAPGRIPAMLTAFWPMCGHGYTGRLMVIGRAVNGWYDSFPHRSLTVSPERQRIIAEKRAISESDERCPMLWVTDCDGTDPSREYNTNISAFWRVIRGVATGLNPLSAGSRSWPSQICWSNLYKVAPHPRGNPTGALQLVQRPYAVELLQREIERFKPTGVLVLTGRDWFSPFAEALDLPMKWSDGLLEGIAHAPRRTYVVAPHPQGKDGQSIIAGALALLGGAAIAPGVTARGATRQAGSTQAPRSEAIQAPARTTGHGVPSMPLEVERPRGVITGLKACTWKGQTIYRVLVDGRETRLCGVHLDGRPPTRFFADRDAANRATRRHVGDWIGYRPDGSNNSTSKKPGPPVSL